jgi:hypothetical protein
LSRRRGTANVAWKTGLRRRREQPTDVLDGKRRRTRLVLGTAHLTGLQRTRWWSRGAIGILSGLQPIDSVSC